MAKIVAPDLGSGRAPGRDGRELRLDRTACPGQPGSQASAVVTYVAAWSGRPTSSSPSRPPHRRGHRDPGDPGLRRGQRAPGGGTGVLERVGHGLVVHRLGGGGRGACRRGSGGRGRGGGRAPWWSWWERSAAAWAGRVTATRTSSVRPSITRSAASTMHAPACDVYPDFTPITPSDPISVTMLCTVPDQREGDRGSSPRSRRTSGWPCPPPPSARHRRPTTPSGGRSRWRRRSGCRWPRATRPGRSSWPRTRRSIRRPRRPACRRRRWPTGSSMASSIWRSVSCSPTWMATVDSSMCSSRSYCGHVGRPSP